jgi:WD repeat-containing protein 23
MPKTDQLPVNLLIFLIVTSAQILQLLGANGLRRILQQHGLLGATLGADDEDDDEVYGAYGGHRFRRRRRNRPAGDVFPKVPSDNGTELMNSGLYGSNPYYVDVLKQRKKRLATKLMWRELGIGAAGAQKCDVRSVFQVGMTCDLRASTAC